MATLNDTEQARVIMHLGYPLVDDLATFNTGLPPDSLQTLFRAKEQVTRINTQFGVDRVLSLLHSLDECECRINEGRKWLRADQLDGLKIRADNLEALYLERYRWACELANTIGADVYPYAEKYRRFVNVGTMGINVPVRPG